MQFCNITFFQDLLQNYYHKNFESSEFISTFAIEIFATNKTIVMI